MVRAVEQLDEEGGGGWQRGGLGQCLWAILIEDPDLRTVVPAAMKLAVEMDDVDAAFRLLVIHQYLAENPLEAAQAALDQHPSLRSHCYSGELIDQIAEFGHVDVY